MKEFKSKSFYLKYDENNNFLTYMYIKQVVNKTIQFLCVRLTDVFAIEWCNDGWVDIYSASLEILDDNHRMRLLCGPHKERELLFERLREWFVQ